MSKKVFILGGGQYIRMFIERGWVVTSDFFKADLIQFTGGADVTPEIYGEVNTASGNDLSRDLLEAGYFGLAQRMNKPMAGICRGGQFLNVMCGGSMKQHVEGHATGMNHLVEDTGTHKTITVTSTHHQMMVPSSDAVLVAFASIVGKEDAEVLYYYKQRALCFQPHPEFTNVKGCTDYYFELLHDYLRM